VTESAEPHDSIARAGASDDELRTARHGYSAMVSEVDHHSGRILRHLAATRQDEDTLISFTSDHGDWLGEHLRYGKGYPGDDAVSRVPLIVRWPGGQRRSGRTVGAIIALVGLVPTIRECAALQLPPHLQGRSLAGVLADEASAEAGRDAAPMEHPGRKTLRTPEYRYLVEANGRVSRRHRRSRVCRSVGRGATTPAPAPDRPRAPAAPRLDVMRGAVLLG